MPSSPDEGPRRHTGRRRNESVREAIVVASLRLLSGQSSGVPSIEAVAREAKVGKQTIYRWWPSKAALLIEAITAYAHDEVAVSPSGDLRTDVESFLVATFESAHRPEVANALRSVMSEAQRDSDAAETLRSFVADRRAALAALFEPVVSDPTKLALILDQAFGVVWYRLLVGHAELDRSTALKLADALVQQAST